MTSPNLLGYLLLFVIELLFSPSHCNTLRNKMRLVWQKSDAEKQKAHMPVVSKSISLKGILDVQNTHTWNPVIYPKLSSSAILQYIGIPIAIKKNEQLAQYKLFYLVVWRLKAWCH